MLFNFIDNFFPIFLSTKFSRNKIKISFYDHKRTGKFYIGYIEDESENKITSSLGGATHAMGEVGWLYKLYCTGTEITDLFDVFDCDLYTH